MFVDPEYQEVEGSAADTTYQVDIDTVVHQYTDSQQVNEDKEEERHEPVLSQDSTADELKAEIKEAMSSCDCLASYFSKLKLSDVYDHLL